MQKDVLVRVRGTLVSAGPSEADEIEVISPGTYYEKNGKEYVIFEDRTDEEAPGTRNVLKLGRNEVGLKKTGFINAEFLWVLGEQRMACYTTPFGSVILGIRADEVTVYRTPDRIDIRLQYDLEINYEHISDCRISITITSAGQDFSLN